MEPIEDIEVKKADVVESKPDEEIQKEEEEQKSEVEPQEKKEEEPPVETSPAENIDNQEIEEKVEPKPVEGETPRERALRKEVERLREVNRQGKGKDLFREEKEEKSTNKIQKVDLSKYDPNELESLKGILATMADDLGFVKKDEFKATTYEDKANSVLNEFLEKHPQYIEENDKDGVLWNQFKSEFARFKKTDNVRVLKENLNTAHLLLTGTGQINKSEVAAKQEKIKSASHGGVSNRKDSPKNEPKVDPSLKSHLKGFSDEELSDIYGI